MLVIIGVVFLLPYLWIAASAFKPQTHIFADLTPIGWQTFVPTNATLDNFTKLFRERALGRALVNSAFVAICQVLGTLLLSSMAAYALTRIRFRGRRLIFGLVLASFLLPVEALVVPLYQLTASLHLQDTLTGVFLPFIASPFGLFLLRQHFEEIPHELDEAAKIDGAGHLRIFVSIILPNVKASLVTLGLVIFLSSWNSFLWPLIILQSPGKTVVQIAIAQSASPGELPDWGQTFAGATVATLPVLLLFLFLQRYIVRGIASTGLKG